VAALAAACGDTALVIEVRSDGLSIPDDLDSFCLLVADRNIGGGQFSRVFVFDDEMLTSLPQTLTVEPGGASSAEVLARGYLGGIEVARDRTEVAFSGVSNVPMVLARCPGGRTGSAGVVATFDTPPGTRVAVSVGRGGSVIVAVGPGFSVALRASGSSLEEIGDVPPSSATAAPRALLAFDADGDCDDDILLIPENTPPELWLRGADFDFEPAPDAFPSGIAIGARAAAAADVDGDGDLDIAVGGASNLQILVNDGTARFFPAMVPISGDAAMDVTALAFGDFDGDGDSDLAVGRGDGVAAPARLLTNAGSAVFQTITAALPELPLQVRSLAVRDVDGDGFDDLLIGALNSPVKLYINRTDGRLEDRSFTLLPSLVAIDAVSVAATDWDGDCIADVVIGVSGSSILAWRGTDSGALVDEGLTLAGGTQVVLADVDDDGSLDLIAVDSVTGLSWVRR